MPERRVGSPDSGGAISLGYSRFLDFERLETQNQELEEANWALQRERSVERIRDLVQAMDRASDFEGVLSMLSQDLREVGLAFDTCGIEVLDEPVEHPTMSYFEAHGYRLPAHYYPSACIPQARSNVEPVSAGVDARKGALVRNTKVKGIARIPVALSAAAVGSAIGVLCLALLPTPWVAVVVGSFVAAGGYLALGGPWRGSLEVRRILSSDGLHQRDFTRALSLIVGFDELLSNEIGKVRALAEADKVAILVSTVQGDPYIVRANRGYGTDLRPDHALQDDARLVKWLHTNDTCLVPGESPEVMDYLRMEERSLLEELCVDLVIPLVASNRLVGILLISKPGGVDRDRVEALWSLVPQMALALENAVLYRHQQLRMRRLYRAERLATTGQLAAGAAHEIRNPLASIRSTIQYLRGTLNPDPETAEMMEVLLKETDRIGTIVKGMLSLSRPTEPVLQQIDLVQVIADTAKLVQPTASKSQVKLETSWPAGQAEIRGDLNLLKQVFLNIMMNAVQAMPEGGELSISVSDSGERVGQSRWQVELADTGTGIPGNQQERIFDPFFTTKPEGTGLGLSICHSILQSHGGEIDVESEPGEGTRVVVRL